MSEHTQTPASTRAKRLRPRLIVYTGDGKGKSTAAFGMGLRAWAQGWSVGVYQFVKSGKWATGEKLAYRELSESLNGGTISWQNLGEGFTWLRATEDVDQQALAEAGWGQVKEALAEQRHDMYILDEFNHVLANGWLDLDEVIETLSGRPGRQHVVITGRNAPEKLIDAADLVTSMEKVKHPFDKGERGQAGVEW